MDVRCEKCGTEYEFDEKRIGQSGVTVKCTACGNVFKVHRPDRRRRPIPRGSTPIGPGPQGREWLVRRPDGQMIAFRELTTLQKWIVEGRIGRDDEISKNGETWKRLGNIKELEPFFTVYEKAQTLNRMVEYGPISADVLSSFHPNSAYDLPPRSRDLGLASPESSTPSYDLSRSSQDFGSNDLRSEDLPRTLPSSNLQQRPLSNPAQVIMPPSVPPPTAPAVSSVPPVPAVFPRVADARPAAPFSGQRVERVTVDRASHLRPLPSVEAAGGGYASVDLGATPEQRAPLRANGLRDRSPGPRSGSVAAFSPPLPGPAIDREPAPAALGTMSLDIPDEIAGDPVVDFQRAQRRQRWMIAAGFLFFAAIGVAAGIAAYGPKDNPLRAFVAQYSIRRAPSSAGGVMDQLREAQTALDRDTEASRRTALALLATAHNQHPKDAQVAPWRAFAAAITALSLQRKVDDLRGSSGSKVAQTVASERARAQRLIGQAGDWLRTVETIAPQSREVRLAQAALALAQSKPETAQRSLDDIAAADPEHRSDSIWLHLAAATTFARADPGEEALRTAENRLRTSVTLRPTLIRAHVLLARVAHRRGDGDRARATVDNVLTSVPEHKEAQRLKAAWRPAPAPARSKAVAKAPRRDKTFEDWMDYGDRLRQRDRTTAALNAYGRAAELDPKAGAPQIGKGWCYIDLGKFRVALTAFERAQALDPDNAEVYFGIAEAQNALGAPAKAVEAYRGFLARAPANASERQVVERKVAELEGN